MSGRTWLCVVQAETKAAEAATRLEELLHRTTKAWLPLWLEEHYNKASPQNSHLTLRVRLPSAQSTSVASLPIRLHLSECMDNTDAVVHVCRGMSPSDRMLRQLGSMPAMLTRLPMPRVPSGMRQVLRRGRSSGKMLALCSTRHTPV